MTGRRPWRVGRSVGRTIYDADDRLIGVMDTPALAEMVLDGVNGLAAGLGVIPLPPLEGLRKAIARAVLDDLEDRRGIKQPLLTIRNDDPEVYAGIEATLAAAVIRVLEEAQKP